MLFWNKKKKEKNPDTKPRNVTGAAQAPGDDQKVTSSPRPGGKRACKAKEATTEPAPKQRSHIPVDVKVAAVEARAAGLPAREVAELAGVCAESVEQWCKAHEMGGIAALVRKSSSPGSRRICQQLTERIEARRREHPEHGVRRIRDDLKRNEGLAVSAETVRQVGEKRGAKENVTLVASYRQHLSRPHGQSVGL